MSKLSDEFYAVLIPKRSRYGSPRPETGQMPWESFKVDRIVKGRPTTKTNEVAVRLKLVVDSSIFDKLIPTVEIELGERALFVNTAVEVIAENVSDDSENDLQS